MTHVIKTPECRIVVIESEPESECEICHQIAELRPYGPNGENICVPCGLKDKEATMRRMMQVLFGAGLDS